MSKGKCFWCGHQLKSGDWMLKRYEDGKVIKVCVDADECHKRIAAQGKNLVGVLKQKGMM